MCNIIKLIKLFFFVLFALNLAGCMKLSASSEWNSLQNHYIGEASLEEIQTDLTRYTSNVEAYPITGAFIEAFVREMGYKEGLSQSEINKQIIFYKSEVQSRVGFMIFFDSVENIDITNLKYWGIQLRQGKEQYELEFLHPDKQGYSVTTRNVSAYTTNGNVSISSYDYTKFHNSGLAVTPILHHPFDFTQEFSLILIPRFQNYLKPIVFIWEAPKKKIDPT